MASSVQRVLLDSDFGETVTNIKRETNDECLGLDHDEQGVSKTMALGINSTSSNTFGNNHETFDCVVCDDRATGKHYGAISCDGCKGFFRRSVRKNTAYVCQHQNNCTIDKDKRNQCRHCRWKKCIRMGMKKEAVQKERDRVPRPRNHHVSNRMGTMRSNSHPAPDHNEEEDDLSVLSLFKAEQTAKEYIGRQIQLDRHPSNTERVQATLETICISMNYQLRSLIEWAKDLKSFVELSDNDKIALLRGHTGENLVLGVACRSLICDDYLLLGNHYVIPRTTSDAGLTRAAGRILDEIARPLKEIQVDEKEYACLKAIVFFDNDNKSLSDSMRVRELRKRIQVNLETYINQQKPFMRGRFGELLLLMPPLQNIARLMVDLVARYNQDTKQVDDLINEMLLNRYRDDCQDSMITTTTQSINVMTTPMATSSSSPSNSISKENDLDSGASSLDTDMEDNISQSHDSHLLQDPSAVTPVGNSVLIPPRTVDDNLHDVSMTVQNDYLSSDMSHMHLLHSNSITDPNLNYHNTTLISSTINNDLHEYHHEPVLPFFTDLSSTDQLRFVKQSKVLGAPSSSSSNATTGSAFDHNEDISFLYDLITPPSNIRPSLMTSSHPNQFFETHWNGRITLPTPNTATVVDHVKQELQQRKLLR